MLFQYRFQKTKKYNLSVVTWTKHDAIKLFQCDTNYPSTEKSKRKLNSEESEKPNMDDL
jgi:hypothetical protein